MQGRKGGWQVIDPINGKLKGCGVLVKVIRERWVGENMIQGNCEMREIWSKYVTARKEEEVHHVSPFPITQRLSSVAPLVPHFALERRSLICAKPASKKPPPLDLETLLP